VIGSGTQPARLSDRVLTLVAAAVTLVCILLITTFPWGRDQSIYGVIADGIVHGRAPYRDLWDFKPPGIFFVYALAQALFGRSMTSIRILEAMGLGAMVLGLVALSRKFHGNTLAGWLAGAIAVLAHLMLDFWHTAQPESFGGILTVMALCLIVPKSGKTTAPFAALVAGIALGVVSLMKPPLGGAIIVVFAYLLRQHLDSKTGWRRFVTPSALVLGVGIVGLSVVLYFVRKQAWSAMLWTLRDFVPGYTALGWHPGSSALGMVHYAVVESLIKFSAYIPIGVVAALILPSAHSREKEGFYLICGIALFQLVGVAMQAKFFEYHYGATIPLLAFLAGLGWSKLWWTAQSRSVVSVLIMAALLLIAAIITPSVHDLPGTAWQRTIHRLRYLPHLGNEQRQKQLDDRLAKAASYDLQADRDVAAWMQGQTGPHDTVLVWGFEPAIYWLAERTPATRFIYDVPQRSQWQQRQARQWFMEDVIRNRPLVVAVQHSDIFPGVTGGGTDSAADLEDFPEFSSWLERNYSPAGYRYNFEYYRRRSKPRPRSDALQRETGAGGDEHERVSGVNAEIPLNL